PERPGDPRRGPGAVGRALVLTVAAGLGAVLLGAAAGRADVALLGVGPLLVALGTASARPRGPVRVGVDQADGAGGGVLAARLDLVSPPGTDGVRGRGSDRKSTRLNSS